MFCRNKKVAVRGMRYDGNEEYRVDIVDFECIVTNDQNGKTLSINDGNIQFTIPFEKLQKYLK